MEANGNGYRRSTLSDWHPMKLSFSSNKLRKLCEDAHEMHKRRPDIERGLRRRIAALRANASLADLIKNDPLGKWHRLSENRDGQWAGKVSSNERIIVAPLEQGARIIGIEEELESTEAHVIEIEDYHQRKTKR